MNLAAALPLTGAEKKIAPASRTILIGAETYISKEFSTLKTPVAITSFWGSLRDYAARNHTASQATGTTAVGAGPARKTKTKAVAKTPAKKTRTAGS